MQENKKKPRFLYLQTSVVPPSADESTDRFAHLSDKLTGEIAQPVWFDSPEQVTKALGAEAWPSFRRRAFTYRWFLAWRHHAAVRKALIFWFYITETLKAHKEEPLDCVMAYSHMTTAICGVILKWLTGARLVVEVISAPDLVFLNVRPKPTVVDKLRKLYSDICLHFTLLNCDCVHLLYPWQLDAFPYLRNVPRAVFVEFVPVSAVPLHQPSERRYIMLTGAPWYMKGADILVEAFLRLAPDFPDVDLRILGHNPDRADLDRVIGNSSRVQLLSAVPGKEAIRLISQAEVLVLASRNEGTPRVLLEAMAAGVPVVGTRVGGIPALVRDGENGFLFPSGDSHALEACLRKLLSDAEMRARFGARGREIAMTEFSEAVYAENFAKMIDIAMHGEKSVS